jgi:transaldolase
VVSIQRGSELNALKKYSSLVYDTKHAVNELAVLGPQAATVSPSILMHALSENCSADVGCIEGALFYEACKLENVEGRSEESRMDCVLDKAFVNLASMMASRVEGVVSVEVVESRLHANDSEAIVKKAKRMAEMFRELDVNVAERVLFKIPCTWEGVRAVRRLEKENIRCHVTQVYSLEHAAAAARAGATLVQVYVGRVRTWYQKRPIAAVHNNLDRAADAGVELVKQVSALIKKEGLKTKVMAASVKNKKDAVALTGCDYILLNDRVIATLNSSIDIDGGLKNAFATYDNVPEVGEVSRDVFEAALEQSPGRDELSRALARNAAADAALKAFITQKVLPGVGQ